ncbi:LysR family transcriptional regulator [Morganella morganii]|uniref:LysR family transcriptional regulator n=1 Tax=Morganella morganii TaxID=582 RepID=UPI00236774C1|nr:LysR family transcriptional regulator [Morganella morganii]
MKLPPLSALRFFDAAARSGSFVRAAEELHVTHGAVSRQIRLLEEELGISLFERRNRAVFLTPAGQTLYQTTGRIFSQLAQTVEKIQRQQQDNVITLSCEPSIAMHWLIPRLSHFYQRYPAVTVRLVTAGGAIDFQKTGADIALRRNDFKWRPDIHAVKLCREFIGRVQRPGEEPGDALLIPATRPDVWQTWQHLSGDDSHRLRTVSYEHFYMCLRAALAGQGITVASFLMAADELTSGQLIAPGGFIADNTAYYLLYPSVPEKESPEWIFTAWLRTQINESLMALSLTAAG